MKNTYCRNKSIHLSFDFQKSMKVAIFLVLFAALLVAVFVTGTATGAVAPGDVASAFTGDASLWFDADGDEVNDSGETTTYATFAGAWEAAIACNTTATAKATITLADSVTDVAAATNTEDYLVLNIGACNLTQASNAPLTSSGGSLEIKGTGTISGTKSGNSASGVVAITGGTASITGVTITNTANVNNNDYALNVGFGATVVMNSGTLSSTGGNALRMQGVLDMYDGTITGGVGCVFVTGSASAFNLKPASGKTIDISSTGTNNTSYAMKLTEGGTVNVNGAGSVSVHTASTSAEAVYFISISFDSVLNVVNGTLETYVPSTSTVYAFSEAPTIAEWIGVEVTAGTTSATAAAVASPSSTTYTANKYVKVVASAPTAVYFDPVSGEDSKDGTTAANAVGTFARVKTLATTYEVSQAYLLSTWTFTATAATEIDGYLTSALGNLTLERGYMADSTPFTGTMLRVAASSYVVTIQNITFDGGGSWTYSGTPVTDIDKLQTTKTYYGHTGITVSSGSYNDSALDTDGKMLIAAGDVVIESGTVFQNNDYSANNIMGGGVVHVAANVNVTMNGGTIKNVFVGALNCYGAAVYVLGTFNLNGGTVSHIVATITSVSEGIISAGGGGNFFMGTEGGTETGTITECNAYYVVTHNSTGASTLFSGTITSNRYVTAAIGCLSGRMNIYGGAITDNVLTETDFAQDAYIASLAAKLGAFCELHLKGSPDFSGNTNTNSSTTVGEFGFLRISNKIVVDGVFSPTYSDSRTVTNVSYRVSGTSFVYANASNPKMVFFEGLSNTVEFSESDFAFVNPATAPSNTAIMFFDEDADNSGKDTLCLCYTGTFAVTYDNHGATTAESGGDSTYTISSTSFSFPAAPEKTGYTFAGWKVTSVASISYGFVLYTTYTSATPVNWYGGVTFTAEWDHSCNGITFDKALTSDTSNLVVDYHTQSANILYAGNNYYLDDSFTATGNITVGEGIVNICLNGKTLTMSTYVITVGNGATLNIYDCDGSGKITGSITGSSGVIRLTAGNLSVNSGTVQNTSTGSAIYNGSSGSVSISGGNLSSAGGYVVYNGGDAKVYFSASPTISTTSETTPEHIYTTTKCLYAEDSTGTTPYSGGNILIKAATGAVLDDPIVYNVTNDNKSKFSVSTVGYELVESGTNLLYSIAVYDITYLDKGGATFSGTHGASAPTTHKYGTATTLVSPTRTNYRFDGWFVASACTGTALTSLTGTGYTDDITLYAAWTHYHDSIEFDKVLAQGTNYITVGGVENASDNKIPGGSNVYLIADFTVTSNLLVASGTVNLCLNGYEINLGDYQLIVKGGAELYIFDCSSPSTGKITGNDTVASCELNSTLTLHGGTISTSGSGATSLANSGAFVIDGGTLSSTGDNGVALSCVGSSSTTVSGGTVSSTGSLRAIVVERTATGAIAISGGTIQGVLASIAVYGSPATLTVTGGSFINTIGQPTIYTQDTCGTVRISGGTFTSGTTYGTIYHAATTAMYISGGTISASSNWGAINIKSAGKLYLSGTPSITGKIYLSEVGGCLQANDGASSPTAYTGAALTVYKDSYWSAGSTVVAGVADSSKFNFTNLPTGYDVFYNGTAKTFYYAFVTATVAFDADSNGTISSTETVNYDKSTSAWNAAILLSSSATYPATVKLFRDFTAPSGNFGIAYNSNSYQYLYVPSGKYIALNLNGFDVDRNVSAATDNGFVLAVDGTLTLFDYSTSTVADQGALCGGYDSNSSTSAGCVKVSGKFCLKGGNISGNKATLWASAVRVEANGTFEMTGGKISNNLNYSGGAAGGAVTLLNNNSIMTMTGGEISGNYNASSTYGAGICMLYYSAGSLTVGGTAVVSGNYFGATVNASEHTASGGILGNVWLCNGGIIGVSTTSALQSGASFGVITATAPVEGTPVAVSGANSANYSAYFVSDRGYYEIYNDSNTVKLKVSTFSVSFVENSGTFATTYTKPSSYIGGTGIPLPTDEEILRTGYTFNGWFTTAGFDGSALSSISATDYGNKTLYAKWTVNVYTITYKAVKDNGTPTIVTNPNSTESYTYGDGIYIDTSELVTFGYALMGLYTNAVCTTVFDYEHFATGDILADTTIYVKQLSYQGGGAGTSGSPFLISTAEQLDALLKGYVILSSTIYVKFTDNVTLPSSYFTNGVRESKLDGLSNDIISSFVIDGNGKTVSTYGLYYRDNTYLGLFHSMEQSSVSNLTVKLLGDVAYTFVDPGYDNPEFYAGIVVGIAKNVDLLGVTVDGNGKTVTIDNNNCSVLAFGGLVGQLEVNDPDDERCALYNCEVKNLSVVSENNHSIRIGGLVAICLEAQVVNSIVHDVDVSLDSYDADGSFFFVGGFFGVSYDNYVFNCGAYDVNITATGSARVCVGGLAAMSEGPDYSYFESSYFFGSVSTDENAIRVGLFIGYSSYAPIMQNLYSNIDATTTTIAGCVYFNGTAIESADLLDLCGTLNGTREAVDTLLLTIAGMEEFTTKQWYPKTDSFCPQFVETFRFSYDGNGNTSGTLPTLNYYESGTNVTVAGQGTLLRSYYDFSSWTLNSAGTGAGYVGGNTITVSAAVLLYAKWIPNVFDISYKDKGGSDFSGMFVTHNNYPEHHTYDTATTIYSPDNKAGYLFGGWFIESDCSGTAITELSATGYTDDITLYAKWLLSIASVAYDGNIVEYASFAGAWEAAMAKSTSTTKRATVKLLCDVTATGSGSATTFGINDGSNDVGYIPVLSGDYITLDLNGFVLDRALSAAATNGYVILVDYGGNLKITDGNTSRTHTGDYAELSTGGVLTGGYCTDSDSASCVLQNDDSICTMIGGTIEGNSGNVDFAAFAVNSDSSTVFVDAKVQKVVLMSEFGESNLYISGNTVIPYLNFENNGNVNLYISDNDGSTSSDVFTGSVSILYSFFNNSEVVTNYWQTSGTYGSASKGAVTAYGTGISVGEEQVSGTYEVVFRKEYTVAYSAGAGITDASGTVASQTKLGDVNLTLKTDTFTRDGYVQIGWSNASKSYALGDIYSANSSTTLSAVWQKIGTVFDAKFYKPQVWDCQRSPAFPISGRSIRISGLKTAYNKNLVYVNWADGDYVQFELVYSKVSDIPYAAVKDRIIKSLRSYTKCTQAAIENAAVVKEVLYSSDGTFKEELSDFGLIWALNDDGFLYTALNGSYAWSGGIGTYVTFKAHKTGDTIVSYPVDDDPYTEDEITGKDDVPSDGFDEEPENVTVAFGGTVVNELGAVLSGISVTLTYNSTEHYLTTDANGCFVSESIVLADGVTAYTISVTDGTHARLNYNKSLTETGFGNDDEHQQYPANDTYVYPTNPYPSVDGDGEYLTYTVTVAVDSDSDGYGTVVGGSSVDVGYGALIVEDGTKLIVGATTFTATKTAATAQYTYTFEGWSAYSNPVSGDVTIYASFTRTTNQYAYTFYDEDGVTVKKNATVDYGTAIVAPTDPSKAATAQYTYSFDGWYTTATGGTKVTDFGTIDENGATFYARYTSTTNQYAYTFYDEDGVTVKKNAIVDYGTAIVAPADPSKAATAQYTYSFDGWYTAATGGTKVTDFGTIDENGATFYARYTSVTNTYSVTWKNYDGTVLKINPAVVYGATPEYSGTAVSRPATNEFAYEFKGWTPAIAAVTGNAIYTAEFTAKSKIVVSDTIDPTDPNDQDKVDAEIASEDGFAENTTLIVKVVAIETVETSISLPDGKEFAKTYNATLFVDGAVTEPSGIITVKFARPASLPAAESYTIIIVENGETVAKTATVEGDYLKFTTSVLGDFAIIKDKSDDGAGSLLWLIILLSVINAIELVAIGVLLKRNSNDKKNAGGKKTVKAYSFVGVLPLLSVVSYNESEVTAVAVLAVFAVIFGAIIVYLALKTQKAKQERLAHETAASSSVFVNTTTEYTIIDHTNDGAADAHSEAAPAALGEVAALADDQEEIAVAVQDEVVGEDLKEVIATAAVTAVVHVEISKKTVADYLENTYGDKVAVNRRANYTSTNLPLADTHFVVRGSKKICFTFVYELDDGKVFLLLKTDKELVEEIKNIHTRINPSRFPKSTTGQWYSLIIDDSFHDGRELFDILSAVYDRIVSRDSEAARLAEKRAMRRIVENKKDSVSVEEVDAIVTNADANLLVETDETRKSQGGKKYIVNLDVISEMFSVGETVDLEALKAHALVPKSAKSVKILGRGVLDKPLTVYADDYSVSAVKMILLTGGAVIQLK